MWEYRVDQFDLAERWSAKRQAEEMGKFRAALASAGNEGWEMHGKARANDPEAFGME